MILTLTKTTQTLITSLRTLLKTRTPIFTVNKSRITFVCAEIGTATVNTTLVSRNASTDATIRQ